MNNIDSKRANTKTVSSHEYYWLTISLVGIIFLYLLTLSKNHTEGEDSIYYIMQVTDGSADKLFHPNHLLFNYLHRIIYNVWIWLGYTRTAELSMQLVTVVTAIICLFLIYSLAKKISLHNRTALFLTGLVTTSYGFWIYSVQGETYIPPLLFVLLSGYQLVNLYNPHAQNFVMPKLFPIIRLGIYAALATLIHQQHVFLIPVIALTLFEIWRKFHRHTGIAFLVSRISVFLGTAISIVGTTYLYVSYTIFNTTNLSEAILWAKGSARGGLFTPFSWTSPLKAVVGMIKTVWGTNFLFGYQWFSKFAQSMFPNKLIVEEQYLADSISNYRLLIISVSMVISGIIAGILLARLAQSIFIKKNRAKDNDNLPRKILSIFCIWFLAIYGGAIILWEPDNIEFWIAVTPIFYLWIAIQLNIWADNIKPALYFILLVTMFLANLLGGALPYSSRQTDYWYQANAFLIARTTKSDLIITECGYICTGYLEFYTDGTILPASSIDSGKLVKTIQEHHQGNVIISSWALTPPPGLGNQLETRNDREILATIDSFKDNLVEIHRDKFQTLWQFKHK